MNRVVTAWVILLALFAVFARPEPASAHAGDSKADLILAQAPAGAYRVTLQVRSAVGMALAEADVLLPGHTVDGQPLPVRGTVEFVTAPLGADGQVSRPWTTERATWDRVSGHYRALLPIDAPGRWAVRVVVDGAEGSGEIAGTINAYPPRDAPPAPLLILLTLLPAGILGMTYFVLRTLRVPVLSTAQARQP